jgi:cytochrome c2
MMTHGKLGQLALAAILAGCWAMAADPQHGGLVLRENNCLQCHSIRGEGAGTAPDLSRDGERDFTAIALASTIWNHAATMGPAIKESSIPRPRMSETESEDLFVYLYELRFPDRPGAAQRGGHVFEKKGCSDCHSLSSAAKGPGTPVPEWKTMQDPVVLVQQMWNHAARMKSAFAQRSRGWATLSGQDLADITAYIQGLRGSEAETAGALLPLPDPSEGKPWFDANCRQCHRGTISLTRRLANKTYLEIAAGMWNHLPRMLTVPIPSAGEMRKVVAYVRELQYMGPNGSVARGREVFEKKSCAACHNEAQTGASKMARGEKVHTPFSMVSLGWVHGRYLQPAANRGGARWPRLTAEDIADLIAYMNSRP